MDPPPSVFPPPKHLQWNLDDEANVWTPPTTNLKVALGNASLADSVQIRSIIARLQDELREDSGLQMIDFSDDLLAWVPSKKGMSFGKWACTSSGPRICMVKSWTTNRFSPEKARDWHPLEDDDLHPTGEEAIDEVYELRDDLESSAAYERSHVPDIVLEIQQDVTPEASTNELRSQGYTLNVSNNQLTIVGGSELGVFYGVASAVQMVIGCKHTWGLPLTIPAVSVRDWPSLRYRGVSLDCSEDRVPSLLTLYQLAQDLALHKVSSLMLEIEATFECNTAGTLTDSRAAFTKQELNHFDEYCHSLAIELVPFQRNLGGMSRWVQHRPELCETQMMLNDPSPPWAQNVDEFGHRAWCLAPGDDRVRGTLKGLMDELLPCFPAGRVHTTDKRFVNMDLSIPRSINFPLYGRCASEQVFSGTDDGNEWHTNAVLHHAQYMGELAALHGRSMMMSSQVIAEAVNRRAALQKLPLNNGLVLLMSTEDGNMNGGEDSTLQMVQQQGVAEYVVVADALNDSTIGGFADGWLRSCTMASELANNHWGRGVLTKVSGLNGHLQPLAVELPAMLGGAMAGWCAPTGEGLERDRALMEAAVKSALAVYELRCDKHAEASFLLGRASQVALGLTLEDGTWAQGRQPWQHGHSVDVSKFTPGGETRHQRALWSCLVFNGECPQFLSWTDGPRGGDAMTVKTLCDAKDMLTQLGTDLSEAPNPAYLDPHNPSNTKVLHFVDSNWQQLQWCCSALTLAVDLAIELVKQPAAVLDIDQKAERAQTRFDGLPDEDFWVPYRSVYRLHRNTKMELRARLTELRQRFEAVWLTESRPEGQLLAAHKLENLDQLLAAENPYSEDGY